MSQTPTKISNQSATLNAITAIPNFTTGSASSEKDTDNSLITSNSVNADLYIDSAYEKNQIVRFKNKILQSSQGDIKNLFDSEFEFLKSRHEDLVVKSNATFNSQTKHLQEELKSKDEIINQTLILLSDITNTVIQSKSDIVNKLIDASFASN